MYDELKQIIEKAYEEAWEVMAANRGSWSKHSRKSIQAFQALQIGAKRLGIQPKPFPKKTGTSTLPKVPKTATPTEQTPEPGNVLADNSDTSFQDEVRAYKARGRKPKT